jgi:phosphoserine aminotransferase
MNQIPQPATKPNNPNFGSGPCAKRPGWSLAQLNGALLGRSHRSAAGKAKLAEAIARSRALLELPDDYLLGIVPASDTGAIEMALWSLLGARGVDIFAWESFGQEWVQDVTEQLRLPDVRSFKASYGELPDLGQADWSRDVVFCWNGTTSGVRVPDGDWIAQGREGLSICDATSAVLAMPLPWDKLDVVTYSWQKVLGGEAQHGMIALSPRAVERLQGYTPAWPIPKLFRLTKKGKLISGIFAGETINTPSLLCVEDLLDALGWAESLGGQAALINTSNQNFQLVADWVAKTPWIDFLASDPATRSNTSVCLKIVAPWFVELADDAQQEAIKKLTKLLEAEKVAYDIAGYRDAPAGLRIWCGATVSPADIAALLPWIDWAYAAITP